MQLLIILLLLEINLTCKTNAQITSKGSEEIKMSLLYLVHNIANSIQVIARSVCLGEQASPIILRNCYFRSFFLQARIDFLLLLVI